MGPKGIRGDTVVGPEGATGTRGFDGFPGQPGDRGAFGIPGTLYLWLYYLYTYFCLHQVVNIPFIVLLDGDWAENSVEQACQTRGPSCGPHK